MFRIKYLRIDTLREHVIFIHESAVRTGNLGFNPLDRVRVFGRNSTSKQAREVIGIVTTSDVLKAFLEVTGASTPGSIRMNLLRTDHLNLVDITQLIHAVNGEVLAVGTYEEPVSHRRAYFLRIAGADAAQATAVVQQKGYSLL